MSWFAAGGIDTSHVIPTSITQGHDVSSDSEPEDQPAADVIVPGVHLNEPSECEVSDEVFGFTACYPTRNCCDRNFLVHKIRIFQI